MCNLLLLDKVSRLVLVCLLLLIFPAISRAATQVYQWENESGNTVYSDEPQPGAKHIRVPEPSVYSAPGLPPVTAPASSQGPPESAYDRLQLAEPRPGATIWDNQGNFRVRFDVRPRLRTKLGDRLVVFLDGKAQAPVAGTQYAFENVDRGAHELKGAVVDADGDVLVESEPATIYLQQQSINYPARRGSSP